jgi:N-succinyldiaminopimelate aminotransferase
MTERRDRLASGLASLGWRVLPTEGTYFLCVDIAELGWERPAGDDVPHDAPLDSAFCQWLVSEVGVAAIPVSAFYDEGALTNVVRFCFCKKQATIDAALERLAARFG